ncbi:SNF2 family N-terminal domain-containing protein [Massariosphaeria phaeospora]|uniref:SNF2 family N-terminal domain-containing protein n=1 Tax=Massariosphaeria phaeospora TaxID=100035 RepID=A0A7C8M5V4_9PLEO|nr:SNF2 family N-terminal domain-containing protein [Massariosphaeria phaeospora]
MRTKKAARKQVTGPREIVHSAPASPAPQPGSKNSSSKKLTRSSRTFVNNSSDIEDNDVTETELLGAPPAAARRTLKAVSIPAMGTKKATPARGRLSAAKGPQMEQGSSTGSISLENSDYETPGTSISTTPATSMRRGARSTGKSAGIAAGAAGIGPSSRKRSRLAIADSEDEDEDVSADAQLAMRMQKAEYAKGNKRLKTGVSDMSMLDSDHESYNDQFKKAPAYKGKGKGKAKVEDSFLLESDDELCSATSKKTPSYAGKGKGKAKAEEPASSRNRSARSSAKRAPILSDDDMLSEDPLDSADEFMLDEDDLDLVQDDTDVDDVVHVVSDSDDVPLKLAASRVAKKLATRASKPARARKVKRLNRQQQIERERRTARFAHIEDKWERRRAMNRERAEISHPKLLTMWDDLKAIPVPEVHEAEQPSSISRRLKPFQLEGLSWMIRQEKTNYKGGLLGDEMGMGKTIQAVSLIMSDYPAKTPTLVVVPPVALMQWSNEIREYTDGKLKVLVYHGTNTKCKKMSVKDLKKFDVIMVSYNSLESLHRKETKGWSRGEDIIKEASPLHAIHYHRLILDEAHSIKSRVTGVAKACFALRGSYKWCLSGTPVQNRIGEFFSLLRFLEVRPFADYFCRTCDCEQLHWGVDEDHMCTACNHGGSEHISVFNQELLNPITGDDPELRDEALSKLHMITARIMLRRMKRDNTNSMELPMKEVIIHNEFFSDIERDFSSSIMTNSARNFDTYVAQGVMLNNYANIFGLIMQMRQVANHPDLLLKKKGGEGSQNVFVCNICDEPAEDAIRSRCHHEFCRACVKDYMDTCETAGTDADCPRCHIALTIDFEQPELEQDEDQVKKTSIINRIKMDNWTSSTKIEMLVYDLYKLRSKKQTLKSIVFSQFTSMLQLVEWRLRRAGFNTVMLDGSMTPAMRQKSIEHFMTNPDVEVFLVSLKAGGVALNLTEASRVFIIDPWWNPAAEWQSADRCHRIGQKRPCVITRLCIEDSVESRMVALQEKKAAMIAGTVNNDKVAMDRLTPEDLQFLFRGS